MFPKLPATNPHFLFYQFTQDSESNDVSAEAKVQISDDENDQQKSNGINNIEATITTVNSEDNEIFQYCNGHKTNHHHHAVSNGAVAATE